MWQAYVWTPWPQAGSSLVLRHEEHILASLLERRKEKTEEAEDGRNNPQKTEVRGVCPSTQRKPVEGCNAWQLPRIMTIILPFA